MGIKGEAYEEVETEEEEYELFQYMDDELIEMASTCAEEWERFLKRLLTEVEEKGTLKEAADMYKTVGEWLELRGAFKDEIAKRNRSKAKSKK